MSDTKDLAEGATAGVDSPDKPWIGKVVQEVVAHNTKDKTIPGGTGTMIVPLEFYAGTSKSAVFTAILNVVNDPRLLPYKGESVFFSIKGRTMGFLIKSSAMRVSTILEQIGYLTQPEAIAILAGYDAATSGTNLAKKREA